jgi:hypothetical protein
MGEHSVKNIARPVRVYTLRPEALVHKLAPGAPAAPPIYEPPAAPRLSIVVLLPFTNLNNDPEQQYFAHRALSRAEGCWTFDARDQMPRPSRATAHRFVENAPTQTRAPSRASGFVPRPTAQCTPIVLNGRFGSRAVKLAVSICLLKWP